MSYTGKRPITPWTRTKHITAKFTIGELADLSVIADHWDVSVGTAIWGVIAEWLAVQRKRDLAGLPYPHSSRKIIMRARELERLHEESRDRGEEVTGPLAGHVCPLCGNVASGPSEDGAGPDREPAGVEAPESIAEPGGGSDRAVPGSGSSSEEAGAV